MNDHTCRVCAAPIVRKPGPGRWPHFCGDECRASVGLNPAPPVRLDGSCFDCGRAVHRRSKRCADCHLVRARDARSIALVDPGSCALCGAVFQPKKRSNGAYTRCCSKSCARKLDVREGRNNLQDGTQVGRDPVKRRRNGELSTRKRRARIVGVASERYTRLEIAERDEFVCWLCNEPVDMSLRHPDPRSASVDHVIPLSLGGDDLKSNVRLAHLGENLARGNRVDWEVPELADD